MNMNKQLEIYRIWRKENPDWELICDIENQEKLYVQWHELSKSERMYWVGSFRDPKGAFEEFGAKACKVDRKCLTESLDLCDPLDWPEGVNMLVFRTAVDGVRVI
jgi:hypothetical protein